jgi:hypothetical protein
MLLSSSIVSQHTEVLRMCVKSLSHSLLLSLSIYENVSPIFVFSWHRKRCHSTLRKRRIREKTQGDKEEDQSSSGEQPPQFRTVL